MGRDGGEGEEVMTNVKSYNGVMFLGRRKEGGTVLVSNFSNPVVAALLIDTLPRTST
jgi:hypothetical protein